MRAVERAAAVGLGAAARAAKLGHGGAAAVVDFSVIGPDEHGRVYHQNAFGYGGRKQDERARWSYNPVQPPEFTAAPPPAFVFASADSVVLAFAPALLARRRRLVRFGCRLVGIVVEFNRAIGHQHLAVGVFEVRFGERRRRLARTALVGVPRQRLAALEVEVIGRAIDRHPGTDFIREGGNEDWACAHRITSIAATKTSAREFDTR